MRLINKTPKFIEEYGQAAVLARLLTAGMSTHTAQRMVDGDTNITAKTILQMVKAFDAKTIDEVIGIEEAIGVEKGSTP